ncbi:MAG: beta-Ala-His dipeptidase [Halieaceae bacterium]|nr:beta-Ala-His dipeptidase [Halieaceae bacterium]
MTLPANYPVQPEALWQRFYEITQIPRPSAEEAAVRDHVIALAEAHDCAWKTDNRGNLVVAVPGSQGREGEPPVIIQNHLDMVTVKTDDKQHDFQQDPLTLQVEEDWLLADRTTLGADNGIGCAAALALMTTEGLSHPPLELLFTVEEESGLWGASDLDPGLLTGRRMLNLDSEDWPEFFVGCAGGRGWIMRKPLAREAGDDSCEHFTLRLRGLAGGHSGIQIHQQLGNAIKLLGHWLIGARAQGARLVAFEGGIAHNVIPREASLTLQVPAGSGPALEALNQEMLSRWQSYLPEADNGLTLELEAAEPGEVLTPPEQAAFEQLLQLFPHGAMSYNAQQPADLVDLSINMAVVRVDRDGLFVETTLRYFNREEAEGLAQQVMAIAEWQGMAVEQTIDYPGWQPDFDSELLALGKGVYAELFGGEPEVKAIHAGLECGILKGKLGECDILSFGPTIRGAHSPRERLEISTVEPFWRLLTGILERL